MIEESKVEKEKGLFERIADAVISLPRLLKETLDIRDGTDKKATIKDIQTDISFKGHKAWILIASVIIASVGLNMNSTAVIIGAMLISPLMGPILGIGLSIGINDWETLKRSTRNIIIAVILSIISSFLYFKISPITAVSSELLSRTTPTLLDVFVAFFGGAAGILAGSRGEKINVVPGVAIATALMPPLCTAGYGLANQHWDYFFGAMYLFLLNSVFIALSTLIIVKFLRFPIVSYVNLQKRKKIQNYITGFIFIIMIPSAYLFYNVIKTSIFERNVNSYIVEIVDYPGAELINHKVVAKKLDNSNIAKVDLYFIGETIPVSVIENWKKKKVSYELESVEINFHQQKDNSESLTGLISDKIRVGVLEDIYKENEKNIKSKEEQIKYLEEIVTKYRKSDIPFERISKEAKINHVKLKTFGYSEVIRSDYEKIDTIPIFTVTWEKGINIKEKKQRMEQLTEWLSFKLENKKVQVLEGK